MTNYKTKQITKNMWAWSTARSLRWLEVWLFLWDLSKLRCCRILFMFYISIECSLYSFFRNLTLHCIGCCEFYDLQDPETTKRPQISHDQSHFQSTQRSGSQSGSHIFCDLCSFHNLPCIESWIRNPWYISSWNLSRNSGKLQWYQIFIFGCRQCFKYFAHQ